MAGTDFGLGLLFALLVAAIFFFSMPRNQPRHRKNDEVVVEITEPTVGPAESVVIENVDPKFRRVREVSIAKNPIDAYNMIDDYRFVSNVEPYDAYRWPRSVETGYMAYESGRPYKLGPMDDRYGQYDGPTERVLRRPNDPVGPWERMGALTRVSEEKPKVLPFFGRRRGFPDRSRYDYRTVYEDVPITIATNSKWISDGEAVEVRPFGSFTVSFYEQYI